MPDPTREQLRAAARVTADLPRLVREAAWRRRVTLENVGYAAGVDPSVVNRFVNGRRGVTRDTALLLIRWLATEG